MEDRKVAPLPTIEFTSQQLDALRTLLGAAGSGMPDCLGPIDVRVGILLGCDRYVLYQDVLLDRRGRARDALVRADGSIDLNAAEAMLGFYSVDGLPVDLGLAERVVSESLRR